MQPCNHNLQQVHSPTCPLPHMFSHCCTYLLARLGGLKQALIRQNQASGHKQVAKKATAAKRPGFFKARWPKARATSQLLPEAQANEHSRLQQGNVAIWLYFVTAVLISNCNCNHKVT